MLEYVTKNQLASIESFIDSNGVEHTPRRYMKQCWLSFLIYASPGNGFTAIHQGTSPMLWKYNPLSRHDWYRSFALSLAWTNIHVDLLQWSNGETRQINVLLTFVYAFIWHHMISIIVIRETLRCQFGLTAWSRSLCWKLPITWIRSYGQIKILTRVT